MINRAPEPLASDSSCAIASEPQDRSPYSIANVILLFDGRKPFGYSSITTSRYLKSPVGTLRRLLSHPPPTQAEATMPEALTP